MLIPGNGWGVDRFRLLEEMFFLFQFPCPLLSQLLPKHDPTCLRRGRQNLQVTFQELQTPINNWQLSRNDCEMRKINCGDNVEAVDWSVCRFNSAKSTCQVTPSVWLRLSEVEAFSFFIQYFLRSKQCDGIQNWEMCNASLQAGNGVKQCQKVWSRDGCAYKSCRYRTIV